MDRRRNAHLACQAGRQPAVIIGSVIAARAKRVPPGSAGQRERHAVAGERRDHRRLIAETEQPGRVAQARGVHVAVRQAGDRQWPIEQRARAGEARAQMRAFLRQRSRSVCPTARPPRASLARGQQCAQHRPVRFHELQSGIAAGEQHQFDMAAQRRALRGIKRVIHLQPHQAGAAIGRATPRSSCLPVARKTRVGSDLAQRTAVQQQRFAVLLDCARHDGRAAPWRRWLAPVAATLRPARGATGRARGTADAWSRCDSGAPGAPR